MLKYKEIFLGNACSNSCLHCSYRREDQAAPDLSSVLKLLGEKEEDSVLFYGGEPTLRRDFLEMVRSARENGYRRIKVLSNGRSFSSLNFLSEAIGAGCHLYEIKLFSFNPSLHDYLSQASNSFWETIRGLENLAGLSEEKVLSVRIPVSRENLNDIENTVATVLNFGVNRIILFLCDQGVAIGSVLPHLRNAINISIFNRTWIHTEGMPFCAMQGMQPHIGEIIFGLNSTYGKTFRHHKFCMECVYRELCPGMEAGYLEQHGDREFPPVINDRYYEDVRKLYE